MHPVLFRLPVALWCASLVLDLIWLQSFAPDSARISYLCIATGTVLAILGVPQVLAKPLAGRRLALYFGAITLSILNFFVRSANDGRLPTQVPTLGLILSSVTVGGALFGFLTEVPRVKSERPDSSRERAPKNRPPGGQAAA
jgi:uncharacterized membrane protein